MAEDTDLTMALCRTPWRIVDAADAIAWTEAPATVRTPGVTADAFHAVTE